MNIDDIAKLAGVSKSAVSIALNGKPGVSAETRQRILAIAEEHNYTPRRKTSGEKQSAPKSLTFLVAANSGIVLAQYYEQPFFRELIHFIEERSRYYNCSLVFSSVQIDSFEQDVKALAADYHGDGVILLGTNLGRQQIAAVADSFKVPLVVLDTCDETLPVHFVQMNNFMGAWQAGKHLCELGHRQIAYLASNIRIRNFDDRRQGFDAALQDYGLAITEENVFSVAPTILSSQEGLKQQLNDYLAAGRSLPTAFFCECDYIAISAIKTLGELGYRIPEDVSIVGFDNIAEARIVSPELTTVHVEKERIAQLAVDLLAQSFEAEPIAKCKIMVDTRFVARASTAPLQG